jgi:NAD(P) transhydrogenase
VRYQISLPHIYAAREDVIGFPSLASSSMEQGRSAACHAFGVTVHHRPHLIPYGIYTVPEISMVGLNERQLIKQEVPYEIGIARYREIARGQILGDKVGTLKLLFHQDSRQLLGVHAIGQGATELIHIGQTAMAFNGTIDYFIENTFNYPTLAECYRVAALNGHNKVAVL